MKFKVGDTIRIKNDLCETSDCGGFAVVETMLKHKGKVATITSVSDVCKAYELDIDCGWAWWTDKMLEPIFAEGGLIPTPEKPVPIEEQLGLPKGIVSIHDIATHELWTTPFIIPDEVKEVIKKTEEKKMPTKFTFYVTEGTRVDKSCNGTIPTMTTMVSYIDKYGCIIKGTATCDKTDYDERQGVLEAFANATCGNDFYKVYAGAVKEKKHRDITDRTCSYCGKVYDTIEDKNEHEAWHVERRKVRHERYLLRKRAKEIAFENAAQKLAKEMVDLK